MKKRLTKADFEALAVYDHELMCAKSDYLRTTGREGVQVFKRVFEHLFGTEWTESDACGHCELRLMQAVMDSYFYTKELNEKAKAGRTK